VPAVVITLICAPIGVLGEPTSPPELVPLPKAITVKYSLALEAGV